MAETETRPVASGRAGRAALAVGVVLSGVLAGYLLSGRGKTPAGPRAAGTSVRGELDGITSIALGPGGTVHVGGEFGVKVLGPGLDVTRGWRTEAPVTALDVDGKGEVYAACGGRVRRFDPRGRELSAWGRGGAFDKRGAAVLSTSKGGGCDGDEFGFVSGIAVSAGKVFVADAGARMVFRFGADGTYLGRIGAKEGDPDGLGFVVPSPYFDVAAAGDVLVVTNPGRHRVERYDLEGNRRGHWGREDGEFAGCCNPTNIALFADGRVAASQKGRPVVKVFDPDGKLLALYGKGAFDRECRGIDLAVDPAGRIYAVDPVAPRVRVFEAGRGGSVGADITKEAGHETPR
jgi:hypothetical protein